MKIGSRPRSVGRPRRARSRLGVAIASGWVVGIVLLLFGLPPIVPASPSANAPGRSVPPPRAGPSAAVSPATPLARTAPGELRAVGTAGYSLGVGWSWSRLSSTEPAAEAGAGFAAIGPAGEGILFGGENGTVLSNATVLYNESENRWSPAAPATAPSPRSDFGFGADPSGSFAVLFGGLIDVARRAVTNDTWIYRYSSSDWTNVTSAVAPAPRLDPALAVGDGIALLYGGWAQNISGIGETTYYDTWELNLTTDLWTRIGGPLPAGPGAVQGASMIFDPTLGEFLLYGGCYPCSSAVWAFAPSNPGWAAVDTVGTAPAPRMGAAWALDPAAGLAILFGGTNGSYAFNDTHLFEIDGDAWTTLTTPGAPPTRSRAAVAYLNASGNSTYLLTGGTNGSSPLTGAWRCSLVSNLTVEVTNASSTLGIAKAAVSVDGGPARFTNANGFLNVTGVPAAETVVDVAALGYVNASDTLWVPPGVNLSLAFNLTPIPSGVVVAYVNSSAGGPVAGAFVNLTIGGKVYFSEPLVTGADGTVTFVGVPVTYATILAARPGYHGGTSGVEVIADGTASVGVVLVPLLTVSVHVVGVLPNATVVPLELVAISFDFGPSNLTGLGGWANFTTILFGPHVLHARLYGFAAYLSEVNLNETGTLLLHLRLVAAAFPTVTVQAFLSSGTRLGTFVEDARVTVVSVSPLPTGPFSQTYGVGRLGSVTFSPVPGNYSITVTAPGCAPNDSVPILFAAVGISTYLPVGLDPLALASLHVIVESSLAPHDPIPGALVALNYTAFDIETGNTSPANASVVATRLGWANFSGLPQSALVLTGSAPGYVTNRSASYVAYGEEVARYVLWLTPLPTVVASPEGLRIVPAGAGDVWTLFLLPGLGLLGAVVYLSLLRTPMRPSQRRSPEVR